MTLKPKSDLVAPAVRPTRLPDRTRSRGKRPVAPRGVQESAGASQGELIAALSHAFDVSEGYPHQHSLRTAVVGMRIGCTLGLDEQDLSDLYYALLLKDLGSSSISAQVHHLFGGDERQVKHAIRKVDFGLFREGAQFIMGQPAVRVPLGRRLQYLFDLSRGTFGAAAALSRTRGERGAKLALEMGMTEAVAEAIATMEERFDGRGKPQGLAGEELPLIGRIAVVAQAAELAFTMDGAQAARRAIRSRAGNWFDPRVVEALELAHAANLWQDLDQSSIWQALAEVSPDEPVLDIDDAQLDRIAAGIGKFVDAKSPWTYRHSERVRALALGAAANLPPSERLDSSELRALSRGALLHDVGTLALSNSLLDKAASLDPRETQSVRRHTVYGEHILAWATPYTEAVPLAAGHHERVDGTGYHSAVPASRLGMNVRLLNVAEQFEALTAPRPYREPNTPDAALTILRDQAGSGVDESATNALECFLGSPGASTLLAPRGFDPEQLVVVES